MATSPKWQLVLEDLERRLDAGEFGQRFPTDRELVERYEVSRHTVREAVRRLRARGVVERHRGRGSFVRGREFTQPVGTLYSLFRAVEETGRRQVSEVLAFGEATDAEAAVRLGLDEDAPLVRLERLRSADEEPLAVDVVWLPAEVGRPLLDVDFSHTALYDELDRRCDVRLTSGDEVIVAVVPDDDLREALELDQDEAVFRVERTGRVDDRVVEWRVSLIRGRRFSLAATLDPAAGGQALQVVERAR